MVQRDRSLHARRGNETLQCTYTCREPTKDTKRPVHYLFSLHRSRQTLSLEGSLRSSSRCTASVELHVWRAFTQLQGGQPVHWFSTQRRRVRIATKKLPSPQSKKRELRTRERPLSVRLDLVQMPHFYTLNQKDEGNESHSSRQRTRGEQDRETGGGEKEKKRRRRRNSRK